jgi:hypothetical protein
MNLTGAYCQAEPGRRASLALVQLSPFFVLKSRDFRTPFCDVYDRAMKNRFWSRPSVRRTAHSAGLPVLVRSEGEQIGRHQPPVSARRVLPTLLFRESTIHRCRALKIGTVVLAEPIPAPVPVPHSTRLRKMVSISQARVAVVNS